MYTTWHDLGTRAFALNNVGIISRYYILYGTQVLLINREYISSTRILIMLLLLLWINYPYLIYICILIIIPIIMLESLKFKLYENVPAMIQI